MSTELVRHQERNIGLAYILWIPGMFGFSGIHRLYTGRYVSGVIWLLTGGLCGVGQVIDLIFIPRMVEDHNLVMTDPSTFFVDRDGVLRAFKVGQISREELVEFLAKAGVTYVPK